MRVLVDADACPVKGIIEKISKEFEIKVIMFIDSSHILNSDYSEIITVSQGKDAVDIALINHCEKGDIVVTQDYGVAAMALGKSAMAIGMSGLIYDNDNIDRLMFERFLGQKVRRSGKRGSNPKRRTNENDMNFEKNFRYLCEKAGALNS